MYDVYERNGEIAVQEVLISDADSLFGLQEIEAILREKTLRKIKVRPAPMYIPNK